MDSPAGFDQRWIDPLFAIRCPVVCAPELRRELSALGGSFLADMISLPAGTRPR